jgi:hypothetical protein
MTGGKPPRAASGPQQDVNQREALDEKSTAERPGRVNLENDSHVGSKSTGHATAEKDTVNATAAGEE